MLKFIKNIVKKLSWKTFLHVVLFHRSIIVCYLPKKTLPKQHETMLDHQSSHKLHNRDLISDYVGMQGLVVKTRTKTSKLTGGSRLSCTGYITYFAFI